MEEKKPLILVADDEPEILKIYRTKLEKSGFAVETAENGAVAVEMAKKTHPNLILMDVKMPVMDGVEAFTKLKEDPATKDIRVIFLTAFSDTRLPEIDNKFAAEIGALDFLKKSIGLGELVDKVRQYLDSGK